MNDDTIATTTAETDPAASPTPAAADAAPTEAPPFDPDRRATELAVLDALRSVVDPEIGMNVVELALIKQIILGRGLDRDQDDPDDARSARTPAR